MVVNLDLLESLMKTSTNSYLLYLNDKEYLLENVLIINSPTPVNTPTTRGGVYFSDKFAYKISGIVKDLAIVPFLTKTMLGPNTEFGTIKITTRVDSESNKKVSIHANLTNSVQNKNGIQLNMIIVDLGYS